MRIPRNQIVGPNQYVHIIFKCLNDEFLFKDRDVKKAIVYIWSKYKIKHSIKIFEYILMDNHLHLLAHAASAEQLANFMRVCNSLIAKTINKIYSRRGHALQERYKSPAIESSEYYQNTSAYIWLNRHKVDGSDPRQDQFCSLYFRLRGIANKVLDDHSEDMLGQYSKNIIKWCNDLINAALGASLNLEPSIFMHSHSIGSIHFLKRFQHKEINSS